MQRVTVQEYYLRGKNDIQGLTMCKGERVIGVTHDQGNVIVLGTAREGAEDTGYTEARYFAVIEAGTVIDMDKVIYIGMTATAPRGAFLVFEVRRDADPFKVILQETE